MSAHKHPLRSARLGILGKGGAGKSTVAVLLAQALADRGYQVCVLDADSTNVGLHQALGVTTTPRPLLDYFGDMVFSGGAVTCPVDDPTLPYRSTGCRLLISGAHQKAFCYSPRAKSVTRGLAPAAKLVGNIANSRSMVAQFSVGTLMLCHKPTLSGV